MRQTSGIEMRRRDNSLLFGNEHKTALQVTSTHRALMNTRTRFINVTIYSRHVIIVCELSTQYRMQTSHESYNHDIT